MAMSWTGWHLSDPGWCCPPDSRFHWHEAGYFEANEEHLEIVKSADNRITVAILREPGRSPRPVLVGPSDPEREGLVWVADVGTEEWLPLKEAGDDVWARPVVIHKRRRRKKGLEMLRGRRRE